jgi:transposase-like protein
MEYSKLVEALGANASAIARQFGVAPSTVASWKKAGQVPELRSAQIELWLLRNLQPGQRNPVPPDERAEASSPS